MKKLNLAKVRSAIALTIALGGCLAMAPSARAGVTLAWVPAGTSPAQLAAAGLSPGLMNAGLGTVAPEQTYLDITQGNRVFESLYSSPLPAASVPLNQPLHDPALRRRAESAPAEIVPGLLAATLAAHGRSFAVRTATVARLPRLVRGLRGDDLLIAIERPPPGGGGPLAIGIAGRGFDGNLISDSTRLDGYVLSTDVAPTILTRLGVPVPSQMAGQPIRSQAPLDAAAVESLGRRMAVISHRRGPVIGFTLLAWLVLLALASLATRGAVARIGVKLTGLAIVLLPLVLLGAAAIEPSQAVEMALTMVVPPLLAAAALAVLGGYRALAAAAAATVLAYAIDMVAGSTLTSLSLLGPNPGLGVRFYGIGNELEALLMVVTVAGTGAGICGFAPRLSRRRCAVLFLAVGLLAAFVFAVGRFGADVGAALDFPAGAAAAAAAIAARRRRTILLVIAAPLAVVALSALIDLASGANAHFTRTVLDASGSNSLADTAQRRLELTASSFTRSIIVIFLPLLVLLSAIAVVRRDRLAAWLRGRAAMRAGLIGGVVATVVGTLANDSGALLLEIGAAYLLVFVGYAWAEADRSTTL